MEVISKIKQIIEQFVWDYSAVQRSVWTRVLAWTEAATTKQWHKIFGPLCTSSLLCSYWTQSC